MDKDSETKEMWKLQDLAKETGISYRTLHRAAKEGRIKIVRLGGSIRVPRKERERIIAKGF